MRNAWRLFIGDIKRAFSNAAAITIVIGLVMIPAIFAWFNISASWDPFSNTKNLKVAVANCDDGYKSDLAPLTINIGDNVVNALRGNDELNWQFTDRDSAIDGAKSGEYYAAVIIPEDFSHDMMTFFSDHMEHATITYYQNEKKNGVAPKILGQGATQISSMINTTFTQTITTVGLSVVDSIATYMDSDDSHTLLTNLQKHVNELSTQTQDASTLVAAYGTLVDSSKTLISSSDSLVSMTKQQVDTAQSDVTDAVQSVKDIQSALDAASSTVSASIDESAQAFSGVSDDLGKVLGDASTNATDLHNALQQRADAVQSQLDSYRQLSSSLTQVRDQLKADAAARGMTIDTSSLDNAISTIDGTITGKLQSLHDEIQSAADKAQSASNAATNSKDSILQSAKEANDAIDGLKTSYDSTVKSNLASISSTVSDASSSLSSMNQTLENSYATLSQSSGSISQQLDDLKATIGEASDGLSQSSASLKTISDAIGRAIDNNDLSQLTSLIGDDANALASSIAAPVTVTTNAVYAVDNFGTGLSPLYTSLALWIAGMLMSLALRCEPDEETLAGLPGIKPRQAFAGHFGVFMLLSIVQCLFLSLGEIFFLGMNFVHPVLYVLACVLIGLVFNFFCYSMVAIFGNVGKAINLIFLVMQISGCDGGYPLKMLDPIIGDISHILPATYAIRALRAAICGIYQNDFWIALACLLPFVVIPMILRPLLSPIKRINTKVVARLEASKLF